MGAAPLGPPPGAWGARVGPARPVVRRWLLTAAIVVVFALAAMILGSTIEAELGLQTALLALVLALLPLGIVVPAFLWLDSYEAEPWSYLCFAFLWGGLIATTVSLVLNTSSIIVLETVHVQGRAVAAVVVAPVVEESLKAIGVLLIMIFRRREFDGILDGLVYAGLAAAGFAFAENVLYLGRALLDSGTEGLVAVFVLRCVFGPFAHPLFTCCAGVGIGIAATRRTGPVRILAPALGLILAIGLHGLWNLSAIIGLEGFFTRYFMLQLPIFLAAIAFASWARRREGRLIGVHLSGYVSAGWLSPSEVRMLAELPARRRAREWAGQVGGRVGARAMQAFQDDGSELALLRMRMHHGTAPESAPWEERALLDRMGRHRAVFVEPVRRQGLKRPPTG